MVRPTTSPRNRRTLTTRVLLFILLIAGVVVGAVYFLRWYANANYFVKAENSKIVIYRGRQGGLLWYQPSKVATTSSTLADVPPAFRSIVRSGVDEPTLAAAKTYVSRLVAGYQPVTTTTVTSIHGRDHDDDLGRLSEVDRRIRILAMLLCLCFGAVLIQAANVQFRRASALAASPGNPRVIQAHVGQSRGKILASDGSVLAQSIATPNGVYKYQRQYPTNGLVGQITGVDSPTYGLYGIEAQLQLVPPGPQPAAAVPRPAPRAEDLDRLGDPHPRAPAPAGRAHGDGGPGRRRRRARPAHRRVLAMYSNPTTTPRRSSRRRSPTAEVRVEEDHEAQRPPLRAAGAPRDAGLLPAGLDHEGRHHVGGPIATAGPAQQGLPRQDHDQPPRLEQDALELRLRQLWRHDRGDAAPLVRHGFALVGLDLGGEPAGVGRRRLRLQQLSAARPAGRAAEQLPFRRVLHDQRPRAGVLGDRSAERA